MASLREHVTAMRRRLIGLRDAMLPAAGRTTEQASSDEIRRQMADWQGQRAVARQQQGLYEADAATDDAAALRWAHLDETVQTIDRRIAMLGGALRAAEDRDAADAMRAEEQRLTEALATYHAATEEARTFASAVIANLPDDEVLNLALKLERKLGGDAVRLRREGLDDISTRRPFSPLADIIAALKLRVERVERVRFHPGSPIRLDRRRDDAVAQAIERVVAIKEETA